MTQPADSRRLDDAAVAGRALLPPPGRLFLYLLMLAAAVAVFFVIRYFGEGLSSPTSDPASRPAPEAPAKGGQVLLHLLIALTAVLITGRLLARLFRLLGQPAVIGEVVAGILLGPSLLGAELSSFILPEQVAPQLGVIAQLGVILYMFLVGLELNPARLRARAHATVGISHASIVLPFILGSGLALVLYARLSLPGVSFTNFALFMGVAMSITAFPVLARILQDRGLDKTDLGVIALGCAAIGDVTAWCLLALVVGIVQTAWEQAVAVVVLALAFVAVMIVGVRPLAGWLVQRTESRGLGAGMLGGVLVAVFTAALATEAIGIHAIFGAFLLGVLIPHESRLAGELTRRLHDVVTVLFLPAFFAYTGMRTQIRLVSGLDEWLLAGLIILVATAGKFGGTWLAARFSGFDTRTAAALGALMNTRGLMELIVLNVGLDLGIISPQLFAMMVLMALATTIATTPVLHLLGIPSRHATANHAA